MTEVYLDNAATTRTDEDVCNIVLKVMREDYGNPSSRHNKGMEAEEYIDDARKKIAATLKCDKKNIIFML